MQRMSEYVKGNLTVFNYEDLGLALCFYYVNVFMFYSTELTAENQTSKISEGRFISKSV